MTRDVADQHLGTKAQWRVVGVSGSEHPLITPHRADTSAHLIGKGLKTQGAIARGQRAGNGDARTLRRLLRQEYIKCLIEAALEKIDIAPERNSRPRSGPSPYENVKAVYRVQEEECTHSLVQIVAGAAETVERLAFG